MALLPLELGPPALLSDAASLPLLLLLLPVFLNVAAAAQVVSGGLPLLPEDEDDGVRTHPVVTAKPLRPSKRRAARAGPLLLLLPIILSSDIKRQ